MANSVYIKFRFALNRTFQPRQGAFPFNDQRRVAASSDADDFDAHLLEWRDHLIGCA